MFLNFSASKILNFILVKIFDRSLLLAMKTTIFQLKKGQNKTIKLHFAIWLCFFRLYNSLLSTQNESTKQMYILHFAKVERLFFLFPSSKVNFWYLSYSYFVGISKKATVSRFECKTEKWNSNKSNIQFKIHIYGKFFSQNQREGKMTVCTFSQNQNVCKIKWIFFGIVNVMGVYVRYVDIQCMELLYIYTSLILSTSNVHFFPSE